MNTTKVAKNLNTLSILRTEKDTLVDEETNEINALLGIELQKKVDAIKAKYSKKQMKLAEKVEALEAIIKEDTLTYGETVKGETLKAVYANGRVSWNDGLLMKYADDHPEILMLRSVSSPYIIIRK